VVGIDRVNGQVAGEVAATEGTVGEESDAADFRSANPRFTPEAMAANQVIVDGVKDIAHRLGITPAQVALAWVLAQGDRVVPIPGTKRRRWLEENAAAADVVLSVDDLAEIAALPPSVAPRY
ncbi:MAG: aldo/keto reductase, partial [Actinomycetota bacterium]